MALFFLIQMIYVQGLEWGTAITGFRRMEKSWPSGYKFLVALSWVTVAIETIALFCTFLHIHYIWLYNFWAIAEKGGACPTVPPL
jgi:hypothetical protein